MKHSVRLGDILPMERSAPALEWLKRAESLARPGRRAPGILGGSGYQEADRNIRSFCAILCPGSKL
jgi:hypothetical protein